MTTNRVRFTFYGRTVSVRTVAYATAEHVEKAVNWVDAQAGRSVVVESVDCEGDDPESSYTIARRVAPCVCGSMAVTVYRNGEQICCSCGASA